MQEKQEEDAKKGKQNEHINGFLYEAIKGKS